MLDLAVGGADAHDATDVAGTQAGRAADLIRRAVEAAFAPGDLVTCELGGKAGTAEVFAAVRAAMAGLDG